MYKAHDEISDSHIGVFADVDELRVGLADYFDVSTYTSQLNNATEWTGELIVDVIATLGNKLRYGYSVEGELAWLGISLERIF